MPTPAGTNSRPAQRAEQRRCRDPEFGFLDRGDLRPDDAGVGDRQNRQQRQTDHRTWHRQAQRPRQYFTGKLTAEQQSESTDHDFDRWSGR
jgi:hypothetical protein